MSFAVTGVVGCYRCRLLFSVTGVVCCYRCRLLLQVLFAVKGVVCCCRCRLLFSVTGVVCCYRCRLRSRCSIIRSSRSAASSSPSSSSPAYTSASSLPPCILCPHCLITLVSHHPSQLTSRTPIALYANTASSLDLGQYYNLVDTLRYHNCVRYSIFDICVATCKPSLYELKLL